MGLFDDINRVQASGILAADPEVRYTQTGSAQCKLRIASHRSYKPQNSDEWQEATEWITVVAWNKTAERMAEDLSKGSAIYVEGRLQTRSWDDTQTGQKRYATEVVADTYKVLQRRQKGGRQEADEGYDEEPVQAGPSPAAQRALAGAQAQRPAPAPVRRPTTTTTVTDEDDLPF